MNPRPSDYKVNALPTKLTRLAKKVQTQMSHDVSRYTHSSSSSLFFAFQGCQPYLKEPTGFTPKKFYGAPAFQTPKCEKVCYNQQYSKSRVREDLHKGKSKSPRLLFLFFHLGCFSYFFTSSMGLRRTDMAHILIYFESLLVIFRYISYIYISVQKYKKLQSKGEISLYQ